MKKYCCIQNNIVVTIEPEFIDIFPGIPITQRYSKEFIDACVIVDEDVEVEPGMLYEDGVFKEAPIPEIPEQPSEPGQPTPSEAELLKAQIKASSDRQEFLEDVIAEMAMVVYD